MEFPPLYGLELAPISAIPFGLKKNSIDISSPFSSPLQADSFLKSGLFTKPAILSS
jgi:hypothetical protein